MGEKDFSEIARLSERFNKDPKSRIFVQLADAYRKSNMIDEALEILDKGLAFNPNYPLAHLILGKCYYDKRLYEQAKEAFGKTLSFDPQNIVALRMLAQTCEATKDEEGQMKAYKGILAIDPFDAPAKEKLTYLESIHKKEPLYTVSMAQEYEQQGNIEKALSIYENLSFTDPTDLVLQQKVAELKAKTTKETQKTEEEKIEGLQLDTYFQPDELDKKDEPTPVKTEDVEPQTPPGPETIEPQTPPGPETIEPQTPPEPSAVPETVTKAKPEEFFPNDMGEVIQEAPIQKPVTEEPIKPVTPPKETDIEEPEGLDLLEPIEPADQDIKAEESQPVDVGPNETHEEVSGDQDLLQPIETTAEQVVPESSPETTIPQEPELADAPEDLLQPIEPIEQAPAKPEESVMPKLVDIEDPEQSVRTPQQPVTAPSDQPETSADILQPLENTQEPEIVKEEPAIQVDEITAEPLSESTGTETAAPADSSEAPPESPAPAPEQKPQEAKPQEEDFQSFKDWLGGLLK